MVRLTKPDKRKFDKFINFLSQPKIYSATLRSYIIGGLGVIPYPDLTLFLTKTLPPAPPPLKLNMKEHNFIVMC